ncbi:TetR/AcrR family transcriptional regulator [Neobacillus mesonae]|nr:TetR/AcrR family transcriptional regulator [Neobacillus mesonae]
MPRNVIKDEQFREERCRQILEAATSVFARRGVLTKISDIAAKAGLSHGHIYNYFTSKEQLLLAVIEKGQNSYSRTLEKTMQLPGTAADKFRFLAEHTLLSTASAEMYLVLLQALFTDLLSDDAKKDITARAKYNLSILISLIEEGQRDQTVIQGDPEQLATLLGTMIQNLMLHEKRGYSLPTKDTVHLLLQMISPKTAT